MSSMTIVSFLRGSTPDFQLGFNSLSQTIPQVGVSICPYLELWFVGVMTAGRLGAKPRPRPLQFDQGPHIPSFHLSPRRGTAEYCLAEAMYWQERLM